MAEVLGIVGSVIGIAQLTSTIIITGTKLSAMLKEMQDTPDELSIRLEQLHMLSLSLQQWDCAGVTAELDSFPPLRQARQHCKKCLSELAKMLEETMQKLERSSRTRRKIQLAKHTLQKDQLAKVERRLSHSIKLLNVTNQMYMMHLMESGKLLLLNENSLGAIPPMAEKNTEKQSSIEDHRAISDQMVNKTTNSPNATVALQRSFRQVEKSQARKSTWVFGFACITGALQLEFYESPPLNVSEAAADSDYGETHDHKSFNSILGVPKARIKINLPTWCSGKIMDVLVYRTQVGWSQLLRTRSIVDHSRDYYNRALQNIKNDDLEALLKQFEQRQATPWDEYMCGWNLFTESLTRGKWQICSFLLDYGVETYLDLSLSSVYANVAPPKIHIEHVIAWADFDSWRGDQRLHAYQKLIEKIDQNEPLLMSLLIHWKGPLSSFTTMRRSIWSDEEYYSEAHVTKRMQLVTGLVLNGPVVRKENTDIMSMTRYALAHDGNWTKASIDLSVCSNDGETLLHGLAGIIGLLGNEPAVKEWLRLSMDAVGRCHSLTDLCQASARSYGQNLETPLLRLIKQSLGPRPPFCCQLGDQGPIPKLIERCEVSISLWLECLRVAGVDLLSYGREECQRYKTILDIGKDFGLKFGCDDGRKHTWWGIIHLIRFDYGIYPSQWKFWWSEASDEFVGEFWDMVKEQEISSLRVPGAWVDD